MPALASWRRCRRSQPAAAARRGRGAHRGRPSREPLRRRAAGADALAGLRCRGDLHAEAAAARPVARSRRSIPRGGCSGRPRSPRGAHRWHGEPGARAGRAALDRGALVCAAQCLGVAERMLELASTTPSSASSSASRSAPSRRSSTPGQRGRAARVRAPRGVCARRALADPGRALARGRLAGEARRRGRGGPRRAHGAPGARRDRLHLGSRPAHLHAAAWSLDGAWGDHASTARVAGAAVRGRPARAGPTFEGLPRGTKWPRPTSSTPCAPRRQAEGRARGLHAADLGAHVLKALMARTGVDPGAVEDVIFGCCDTIGSQAGDIARTCWLAAGCPSTCPAPSTASAARRSRRCISPRRR